MQHIERKDYGITESFQSRPAGDVLTISGPQGTFVVTATPGAPSLRLPDGRIAPCTSVAEALTHARSLAAGKPVPELTIKELFEVAPLSESTFRKRIPSAIVRWSNDRGHPCEWIAYDRYTHKPLGMVKYYSGRKLSAYTMSQNVDGA